MIAIISVGLTTGAIAGIVVGCIVGVVLIAAAVLMFIRFFGIGLLFYVCIIVI